MKRMLLGLVMVLMLCACSAGEETFRSGKVLSVAGEAVVIRNSQQIAVYENMVLQGGDALATQRGSQVALRLDEDKYLVVEEESQLTFQLEGNAGNGAIRILLERGSVSHDIENPLSQNDSYEIHTAEAVMAIRGTELDTSRQNGETHVQVNEGKVNVKPNNPDEPGRDLIPGDQATIGGQPPRFQEEDQDVQPQEEPPVEVPPEAPEPPVEPEPEVLCPYCGQSGHGSSAMDCGHYPCQGGYHETRGCGHWHCWGSGHGQLSCGHFECEYCSCNEPPPHVHVLLECGVHTCCDNTYSDHRQCSCLGYMCDGTAHDTSDCGFRE